MEVKGLGQLTIADLTDAYSVILTSETYTFVGTNAGVESGNSCITQVVAFCGTNQCMSVIVNEDSIICPPGITASVTNSGTATPTITFTTNATISESCEATIPISVDGITINKKFSFAVAKAGNNGTSVTVSSTSVTYQVGDSGTTKPTGSWDTTVPDVSSGKFLWTKTVVNYSDGNSTESYSVSYKATDGNNGTSVTVSSTSVTYQVGDSGTTKPTGSWDTTVPDVSSGKFLWTKTVVNYSDGNSTESYSVSYKATDGVNGEDAIVLSITSSNGTVFKNNSGSTVLTAHVYKGSVEQEISDDGKCGDLGYIKWYRGNSTTAVATAKTLSVSANTVTNAEVFTCQLEQ